jgi:hypothetical protein
MRGWRSRLVVVALMAIQVGCADTPAPEGTTWWADAEQLARLRASWPVPTGISLLIVADRTPRLGPWRPSLARELERQLYMLASGNPPAGKPGHDPAVPVFEPVPLRLAASATDMPLEALLDVGGEGCAHHQAGPLAYWELDPAHDPSEAIKAISAFAMDDVIPCAISQHLARTEWWLTDHPDFAEEDHLLAIIVITTGDDCTLAHPGLADPNSTEFEGEGEARCFIADNADALLPLDWLTDPIAAHRPSLGPLAVSVAAGLPPSLLRRAGDPFHDPEFFDTVLRDGQLNPEVDALGNVVPACSAQLGDEAAGPILGHALPPPRLVRSLQLLEGHDAWTNVASLCELRSDGAQPDLTRAFAPIFRLLGQFQVP